MFSATAEMLFRVNGFRGLWVSGVSCLHLYSSTAALIAQTHRCATKDPYNLPYL